MTARHDLDLFSGVDETVIFYLSTVDQAPVSTAGATFTARLLSGGEVVGEAELSPVDGDNSTALTWEIARATTVEMGGYAALARRLAYRLDREAGGKLRTYAHGVVHVTSPAGGAVRDDVREAVVRDKPLTVYLTIDAE